MEETDILISLKKKKFKNIKKIIERLRSLNLVNNKVVF